jgi:hypothetical protein
MNVKGEYEFTLNFTNMFINVSLPLYQSTNLVVNTGIKYFLNRLINDDYGRINAVALGTGTDSPILTNTSLQNETSRNSPQKNVIDNTIYLKTIFNSNNINGTTEIGVYADDTILISRDVYINDLIIPSNSTIALTYTYNIGTGEEITDWAKYMEKDYVYTTVRVTNPRNILEDHVNGYVKRLNLEEVSTKAGSYYYDENLKTIYIHCSDSQPAKNHKIQINY